MGSNLCDQVYTSPNQQIIYPLGKERKFTTQTLEVKVIKQGNIGDAQLMEIKDQQNQKMALILKQINLQNEMILQLKKQQHQREQQQFQELQKIKAQKDQQLKAIQRLKASKYQLERQQIIRKQKIDIFKEFDNIGKSVIKKLKVLCESCIYLLPKFTDYRPTLKQCSCKGEGLVSSQINNSARTDCQNCHLNLAVYKLQICPKCYGYGVLNQ